MRNHFKFFFWIHPTVQYTLSKFDNCDKFEYSNIISYNFCNAYEMAHLTGYCNQGYQFCSIPGNSRKCYVWRKSKCLNFTIPNFVFLKILKYWDISRLYGQFGSHCIAGWEITDQVSKHLLLVFMSLIPDMAFVVGIAIAMALKSCTYGTDPGVSRRISKFLPKLYYVPLCMYVFYRP